MTLKNSRFCSDDSLNSRKQHLRTPGKRCEFYPHPGLFKPHNFPPEKFFFLTLSSTSSTAHPPLHHIYFHLSSILSSSTMPSLCLVCQISNLPLMWESDFRVRVCLHWVVCPSAGIVHYFEGSKKSFTYVKVGLPGSGLSPLGGWSPSWQSPKLLPIPRLKNFRFRGSSTSRFLCALITGIKPTSHVTFSVELEQHSPLPPESHCEMHIFNSSLFFLLRICPAFPYTVFPFSIYIFSRTCLTDTGSDQNLTLVAIIWREYPQVTFRFLALPQEVRDCIYRDVLTTTYLVELHSAVVILRARANGQIPPLYPASIRLAVLQVSKSICHEAKRILYRLSTFRFRHFTTGLPTKYEVLALGFTGASLQTHDGFPPNAARSRLTSIQSLSII